MLCALRWGDDWDNELSVGGGGGGASFFLWAKIDNISNNIKHQNQLNQNKPNPNACKSHYNSFTYNDSSKLYDNLNIVRLEMVIHKFV